MGIAIGVTVLSVIEMVIAALDKQFYRLTIRKLELEIKDAKDEP